MAIKNLIEEIEVDVTDVLQTNFEYTNTRYVPNRSDVQLTFERNVTKKGKKLTTCVLYVDIRNSVELTKSLSPEDMGKVYTAFSKSVLKVAKHHSGHIRNIIGDRVMVVFPSENCFKNAVECAISINHITSQVLKEEFGDIGFKCGIGIDYGTLKVIKVGVQRKGEEATENRSLVWVGDPANLASRLTDVANKTIDETYFEVKRNPLNPERFLNQFLPYTLPGLIRKYDPNAPYYLTSTEIVEMSVEQFANEISSIKEGELYMNGGKFISFKKKTRKVIYPAILMTESVYLGYKAAAPEDASIKNNFWSVQNLKIKDITTKVYGGGVIWKFK